MTSSDRRVWKPDRSSWKGTGGLLPPDQGGVPGWTDTLARGIAGRCPVCGGSPIFAGYLSVRAQCPVCGTLLGEVPADDAPPWVTMFIALHLLIGLVVSLGEWTTLGTAATIAIVLPVSLLLCLLLLRPVKGGVIALLLKLGVRREDQGHT